MKTLQTIQELCINIAEKEIAKKAMTGNLLVANFIPLLIYYCIAMSIKHLNNLKELAGLNCTK